jgi:hypothetical protein
MNLSLLVCVLVVLLASLCTSSSAVTVRWVDWTQRDRFAVEGDAYRCEVTTLPARVVLLRVGAIDLVGDGGISLSVVDAAGRTLSPAPAEAVPQWVTWQGQSYKPAHTSRGRMNVWSAGPYYWDAHLLDVPLVTADAVAALVRAAGPGEVVQQFSFDPVDRTTVGWHALNNTNVDLADGALAVDTTGDDPQFESPALSLDGPLQLRLRVRTKTDGSIDAFYRGDREGYDAGRRSSTRIEAGDWREVTLPLNRDGALRQLRIDPPTGRTEFDWIRVERVPPQAKVDPPLRGEIVLHAHRDQLRIEVIATTTEPGQSPGASATLAWPVLRGAKAETISGRTLLRFRGEGASDACVLLPEGAAFDDTTGSVSLPMDKSGRCGAVVVRALAPGQTPAQAFVNDLAPVPVDRFHTSGSVVHGYDPASGLYVLRTTQEKSAFSFEASYRNPGRRIETSIAIDNDQQPRTVLLKTMTGVGNLEAAVVADKFGFPIPIPAQLSKNFAGEKEEPDDSAFGDAYVPLTLAASEKRDLRVQLLTHGYGQSPLKQVSSVRFFHIYWHLSTGASETTCFTMNWMEAGWRNAPEPTFFHIPDYRPMSGPFWTDQPQHHCEQFPGFLQYNNDARLVYERTDFESISPLLARFTMHFRTSDDAATARVGVIEMPQGDEMRTVARLRYDWHKPVELKGDARLALRLVNIFEFQTPSQLLWTDPSGTLKTITTKADMTATLTGEPLTRDGAVLGAYQRERLVGLNNFHSQVLVRRFKARLGGVEMDQPAMSARFSDKAGSYWLTVPVEKLSLQPGDYVDAEVILMPHGEPAPIWLKPERERERFATTGAPSVRDVRVGTILSDFPATVRADEGVAAFTLRGGFDRMAVIVTDLAPGTVPLMWEDGVYQDQQLRGGDGWQIEPDGDAPGYTGNAGRVRAIFARRIRPDQAHKLVVTSLTSSEGVAALIDDNGRLAIEAPAESTIRLQSPRLIAPGENRWDAKASIFRVSAKAQRVEVIPLVVRNAASDTTIRTEKWDADRGGTLTVIGPCKLSLDDSVADAGWRIAVDAGQRGAIKPDEDGSLDLGPGEHTVIVGPQTR